MPKYLAFTVSKDYDSLPTFSLLVRCGINALSVVPMGPEGKHHRAIIEYEQDEQAARFILEYYYAGDHDLMVRNVWRDIPAFKELAY